MRIDKNVLSMLDSLEDVGLKDLADSISTEIHNTEGAVLEALALGTQQYTIREKNRRAEMLIKRSRIPKECYISNLYRYRARRLDYELIDEFMSLEFLKEGRNVILEGPSGTGKSWLACAAVTEACHRGIRSRWIEFPFLIRDLKDKQLKSKDAYESRLRYYSRFPLLCIDDFLTPDEELTIGVKETAIIKELMMTLEKTSNSLMVTMQCNHKQMSKLFYPEMSGQAIQGRLCQHAMVVDLSRGVDLRLYEPTDIDLELQ